MNRIIYALLFFLTLHSHGQTRISGVVLDEVGEAVQGVNIQFPGTGEGTTTNHRGVFYLSSQQDHSTAKFSYIGFKPLTLQLQKGDNLNLEIILENDIESLSEVAIYQGKTSKKNNPAIDILRKIWEHRRESGVKKFDQYQYRKYEKLEFDLNTLDSSIVNSKAFGGMEFIFDHLDTSGVTGKNFLPVFLNEALHQVYGDNLLGKRREDLLGNKNSGMSDNQVLIASVQNLYLEMDIYDNYLRIFDKNFISPISTTGIDTYNYVLADSAFYKDKWSYRIVYYPRRPKELTFQGDFWVNDTTWSISHIKMESENNANLNWVNGLYLERDYEVYNDSVFLLTREHFMADFSWERKESARGIYGKKTVLYDNYTFNQPRPKKFYDFRETTYKKEVYNREDEFWEQNRIEPLSRNESGVYTLMDTLQTLPTFKRIYRLASIAGSGYVEFDGWDFGPLYTLIGYNDVEGLRTRLGARTYFNQNDPWRVEGYGAYGFRDQMFKYGILGKVLLDHKSRLMISAGHRNDVEQLGATLTNSTDVLGRSLASSSLLNVGDNDKLSRLVLSTLAVELEPLQNFNIRFSASHRNLSPASPQFSLSYYTNEERTQLATSIDQAEISTIISYYPGRRMSGFGVERLVVNQGNFPSFFVNYSVGVEGLFNSDFSYEKIQLFYDQPWWIGGAGLANLSLEAGKIFGDVPLGLLNVIPGNQSFFALYNTFPLLNFYEFVTDTYVSAHFQHNFNGQIFARIPGIRNLNLRELVGIRSVWGEISEANRQLDASGLPLMAPNAAPYYEYSVGVGNIFKFIRIDAHFRGNYFNNPNARSFGVTTAFGFHF